MPRMNGLDVCRKLRAGDDLPILFLSSRDDEIDRVLGLELGGDDYVVKPFSPREVVARVSAILKRGGRALEQAGAQRPISHGRLRLDPQSWEARWDDALVAVTVTEFQLLLLLASHPAAGLHPRHHHRSPARPRLRDHGPDDRQPYPQFARQIGGGRRRRRDRDPRRHRLSDRALPGRRRLIRTLKTFLKRFWPRLRLRTILFATLLFVAALPGFGAVFLRVYENTLVQQTEAELIAQGAVLTSAYRSFWIAGEQVVEPQLPLLPERPTIDLNSMPILDPQPAARPAPVAAAPRALAVAASLLPIAADSSRTTLAVDPDPRCQWPGAGRPGRRRRLLCRPARSAHGACRKERHRASPPRRLCAALLARIPEPRIGHAGPSCPAGDRRRPCRRRDHAVALAARPVPRNLSGSRQDRLWRRLDLHHPARACRPAVARHLPADRSARRGDRECRARPGRDPRTAGHRCDRDPGALRQFRVDGGADRAPLALSARFRRGGQPRIQDADRRHTRRARIARRS